MENKSPEYVNILGGEYRKAMSDEMLFHAVSNLVFTATVDFFKVAEERGITAEQMLDELKMVARGTLIQFLDAGFNPLDVSMRVAKENPEAYAKFEKQGASPSIIDEPQSEVVQ